MRICFTVERSDGRKIKVWSNDAPKDVPVVDPIAVDVLADTERAPTTERNPETEEK